MDISCIFYKTFDSICIYKENIIIVYFISILYNRYIIDILYSIDNKKNWKKIYHYKKLSIYADQLITIIINIINIIKRIIRIK